MKKFSVKYHLGDGIVAESLVEGGEPKDHALVQLGSIYGFKDADGVYHSFQSNDVKMVTVNEITKRTVRSKPEGL